MITLALESHQSREWLNKRGNIYIDQWLNGMGVHKVTAARRQEMEGRT